MTTKKNPLAVMLAADDSYAFALASVIVGLKLNAPQLTAMADFFVYTQNLSPQNRQALLKIHPVTIIDFKLPFNPDDIKTIARYSPLTFARYEAFKLLEQYTTVLYLDSDILVLKELVPLLDVPKNGIAFCRDNNIVAANFLQPVAGFDLKAQNRNAGVMVVNDTIKDAPAIYEACYQLTKQYAAKLNWPDQAILNIILQKFNIEAGDLPLKFNAHPVTSFIKLGDSAILHAMGQYKFWDGLTIKQWQQYYGVWLATGGKKDARTQFSLKTYLALKTKLLLEKIPFLWVFFHKLYIKRFANKNKTLIKRMEL